MKRLTPRHRRKTLIAFEIGNEPEHYGKTWRPADYSYQDFSREISSYLAVMRPKVPHIPLCGPGTTSNFPWFSGFLKDFRRSGDYHPP